MFVHNSTLNKRDKIFMHYTNQFLRAWSTDWYDKTKINLQVQSECTMMRKFRSIQMYMSLHGISASTKIKGACLGRGSKFNIVS